MLGVIQAVAGVARHRNSVLNWAGGAFLTAQVTVRKAVQLGAALPKRLAAGEVVSIGVSDVVQIGGAMDICGRGTGAVVAIIVVAVIMLTTYATAGLVTIAAVPVMAVAMALLVRPLHHRQQAQRERQAHLATRASDIVAGLRVLRGIGGEDLFAARYATGSQAVMRAGIKVGAVDSLLAGAEILLPGTARRARGLDRRHHGPERVDRPRPACRVLWLRGLPDRPDRHADGGGRQAHQGPRGGPPGDRAARPVTRDHRAVRARPRLPAGGDAAPASAGSLWTRSPASWCVPA